MPYITSCACASIFRDVSYETTFMGFSSISSSVIISGSSIISGSTGKRTWSEIRGYMLLGVSNLLVDPKIRYSCYHEMARIKLGSQTDDVPNHQFNFLHQTCYFQILHHFQITTVLLLLSSLATRDLEPACHSVYRYWRLNIRPSWRCSSQSKR